MLTSEWKVGIYYKIIKNDFSRIESWIKPIVVVVGRTVLFNSGTMCLPVSMYFGSRFLSHYSTSNTSINSLFTS